MFEDQNADYFLNFLLTKTEVEKVSYLWHRHIGMLSKTKLIMVDDTALL